MVMLFVTMPEGIKTNAKRYKNHHILKAGVIDDIDSKQREARKKQWQNRTVDSTGN